MNSAIRPSGDRQEGNVLASCLLAQGEAALRAAEEHTLVATIVHPALPGETPRSTVVVTDRFGNHLLRSPSSPEWVRVSRDGGNNWIERETGIIHAKDGSVIHPRDIYGVRLDDDQETEVSLTTANAVRPEPIQWLWPGWLAKGKVHLLAGAPGTGKTTVSVALAATITQGSLWPDGTETPEGDVLIWSGEDDIQDTLLPRLMAAGADLSKVHFITSTFKDGASYPFDPSTDMDFLSEKIAMLPTAPALLIVDPIVAAVSGDSHRNAEVRRALQPLVDLAALRQCAVLGISHFSKGSQGKDPVDRVTGSLAFGALARVVMATARLPDGAQHGGGPLGGKRVMVRAKSNIGEDGQGFVYDLEVTEPVEGIEATRVTWGEALDGNARELLGMADPAAEDGEGETRADVESFVRASWLMVQ
ncbi:MAG: AAA family ATPase [Chromatiales bacterium]|nr:AAA family ATPase [Chromatiales bacterium]